MADPVEVEDIRSADEGMCAEVEARLPEGEVGIGKGGAVTVKCSRFER